MENTETISLLDLGSKVRSKYELYRLLTNEANLYLPPYKECSIEFITDYLEGKKKILKTSQITVKSIPQIDGLRSEDLHSYLINECNAEDFLQKIKFGRFPNRQWLSNLANSMDPDGFQEFVQNAMQKRQKKMLNKRGLTVKVDKDLATAIACSKSVSTSNGRSHLMLNTHKREEWREKKKMIKEWPEQKKLIENMRNEIEGLRETLQEQFDKLEEGEKNGEILGKLYEKGIIDHEGNML